MEVEVRGRPSQRGAVSSRLMGLLNADVPPCWLTVSQKQHYHGDANAARLPQREDARDPVLPEGFSAFRPIAAATAARNSRPNDAVMDAFAARLPAGRPGRR